MPSLVDPVLPAGSLSALPQPVLAIDDHRTLRPWRAEDVAVVRAAFDCPQIQRWHTRRIDSDEEALAWIDRWTLGWQAETEINWAVAYDGRAIGQVGLRGISLASSVAELAYWLLPESRGAGVMAKAVEVMTRWCFDTVGFHRLFLKHSTANMASCRVATTAGYVPEGTFRASMLHADGWHDAHFHARLNEGNDHGAA